MPHSARNIAQQLDAQQIPLKPSSRQLQRPAPAPDRFPSAARIFYGYTAGGPFGYEGIFHDSGPGMAFSSSPSFLFSGASPFLSPPLNSTAFSPCKAASIAGVAQPSAISGAFNAAGGIGPEHFC